MVSFLFRRNFLFEMDLVCFWNHLSQWRYQSVDKMRGEHLNGTQNNMQIVATEKREKKKRIIPISRGCSREIMLYLKTHHVGRKRGEKKRTTHPVVGRAIKSQQIRANIVAKEVSKYS